MSCSWHLVKLADVACIITAKIDANQITKNCYISTENMQPYKGGVSSADSLPSAAKFNSFRAGDTLFSNIRTYFEKVWLASFSGGASADVLIFRTKDESVLISEFLYYFLSSPAFIEFTVRTSKGAKMPRGDKGAMMDFEFQLPPVEIQQIIARSLQGLERKVRLNSQTNQTLEQMAQAIFKSWFVDFDPVKAKMKGEQPEGMDAATAALFPDKLVESELGLIPEGWEAGTIGCVTVAKGGYAFKGKQFIESGNPVVKIKNITSAGTVNTSDCQCIDDDVAITALRFKLSNGDLLMAMTGATVGKSGIYVSDGRDAYLNQRVARFESKLDNLTPCWFTYNLVTKNNIFEQIVGVAQGSAQPNISSKDIEQVKAVIPTHDLIGKYQDLVSPLYAKWISNFRENNQLAQLRDTLLPKLLSGEIKLDTVENKLAISEEMEIA